MFGVWNVGVLEFDFLGFGHGNWSSDIGFGIW